MLGQQVVRVLEIILDSLHVEIELFTLTFPQGYDFVNLASEHILLLRHFVDALAEKRFLSSREGLDLSKRLLIHVLFTLLRRKFLTYRVVDEAKLLVAQLKSEFIFEVFGILLLKLILAQLVACFSPPVATIVLRKPGENQLDIFKKASAKHL